MNKKVKSFMDKLYRKRPWNRAVTTVAAMIVFVTTYMLILPAITLTDELVCPYEEGHFHTDVCYEMTASDRLECPYKDTESAVIHHHDESCYRDGVLVCPLIEVEAHVHTAACYAGEQDFTDGEESEFSAGGGLSLICGKEEIKEHQHEEACYKDGKLICGKKEAIVHQHGSECLAEDVEKVLICGQIEGHIHGENCYNHKSIIEGFFPAITSSPEAPLQEQAEETAFGSVDGEMGSDRTPVSDEGEAAEATMTPGEGEITSAVDDESPESVETSVAEEIPAELQADDKTEAEEAAEETPVIDEQPVADEQSVDENAADGDFIRTEEPEGGEIDGMSADELDGEESEGTPAEEAEEAEDEERDGTVTEEPEGEEADGMPADEKIDEMSATGGDQISDGDRTDDAAERADTEVQTLEYRGDDYTVRLTYGPAASIPADAVLAAEEIAYGTEEYNAYLAQTREALGLSEDKEIPKEYARFFDIKILAGQNEIEPTAPVKVEIIYDKAVEVSNPEAATLDVLHFDEKNDEVQRMTVESSGANTVTVDTAGAGASSEAALPETVGEGDPKFAEKEPAPVETTFTEEEPAPDETTFTEAPAGEEAFVENAFSENAIVAGTDTETVFTEKILPEAAHIEPVSTEAAFTEAVSTEPAAAVTVPAAVAFTADSFSVYGVIYNVEFTTLDGGTYAVRGGKSVLLSELLAALYPDSDVYHIEAVRNVSTSIDSMGAITVNQTESDWEIATDTAVTAPENLKLLVTFANDVILSFDVTITGTPEASSENVTIAPVDGSFLPEEAVASALPLASANVMDTVDKVGALTLPVEEGKTTEYKVFDISLDNVDAAEYEDGFTVDLSFDEIIRGSDFRLYHVHETEDGEVTEDITESLILNDSIDNRGIESVYKIGFVTSDFSEFVLSYTVDFHYEVNGKMYEFSIPGGGFVSFAHLVDVLGIEAGDINNNPDDHNEYEITENDSVESTENAGEEQEAFGTYDAAIKLNEMDISEEAKLFVAEVENIVFSNPELVWIGKVDEETTIGELKNTNGLEIEYSADLTEDQIARINAQTVESGDWVLISVQPFTSEESLTVTMKNGDQFAVKVSDAQISTHVITSKGDDFLITVIYGSEADIPDGAELRAFELDTDSEEYEEHYEQMLTALNAEQSAPEFDDGDYADISDLGLEIIDPQQTVSVAFARFFDISIWKDEIELEPSVPVKVVIEYVNPVYVDSDGEAEIIHFAEKGIELIDPETDLNETDSKGISSFTYEQASFSISATLVKYTNGIPNGNYAIIRGATINGQTHYYALKADGTAVEVTKNGDVFTNTTNNANDAFWTFTNAGNGEYYIQNRSYSNNHLVLYNNIVGNWNQKIKVESVEGRKTVYLKNPNNTPLRWNGNTLQFVLGTQNGNADQIYLARMTSEIPKGQGYDLKPAAETDLGDLTAWKTKVENSKILVDKTASVIDYDNRIYQIALNALSDVTIISNKVDLELIVDTSRSMYFPANLSALSDFYFTSISGNDNHSLKNQLSQLNQNQIYYFIGDGEKATVYALYYAASGTNLNDTSGDQCWKFVDASYMNPPDAGAMNQTDRLNKLVGMRIDDLNYNICNQNRNGGGSRIYSAPTSITRLAYLKEAVRIASEIVYAVDRTNRIGLVTFNSEAKVYQNYTNYYNRQQLYSKINSISLAGGTRQDLGLQKGLELYNNSDPTAQKIAILITDGAPNMQYSNGTQVPSDTAWSWIETDANNLKGTNSSKVKLYTLGLSMSFVGGNNSSHLGGLASEEDGITRHFRAENGTEIASAVKSLIETLVYDATLEAEVTDALDPAFYPVDQAGNPIVPGTYYDENGKEYTWEKVNINGVEHWRVTYKEQRIGRGTKDSSGNITGYGWTKSFYAKAKEDFLGGNNIKTNSSTSRYDHVEAKKCVYTDRATGAEKKTDPPTNLSWGVFSTPYVNVDELHLTENSSTWTVYTGTTVSPVEQLQILWDNIFVKQVVKAGGTVQGDHSLIQSAQYRYYSKIDTADTGSPSGEPNADYSAISIDDFLSGSTINWASMLDELNTSDSVEKAINYSGYGHNPGVITVKLEKTILSGTDAADKAPEKHTTDAVGNPAETYKITVSYTPQTSNVSTIGDLVTLEGEDKVESENTHIINVFQKGIKVTKVDKTNTTQVLTGAVFELYRADENGTEDVTDYNLPDGKYSKVGGELTADANGIIEVIPVIPDIASDATGKTLYQPNIQAGIVENTSHDTVFYLVEKTPPAYNGTTYFKMPGAIKFTLTLTEDKGTDSTATLYNWIQTATVSATEYGNGEESYLISDGEVSNTYAYRVKNSRPSEITLIKVDKTTGNSIGGAKFSMLRGSVNVDLSLLTINAITGGETITPEDYDYNGTNIKVVTIPEGGIRIAGLADDTYTIREVSAPAGYIITSAGKTFKTENGAIKNEDDSAHSNEATDITFRVENTPGSALPNTGGRGTLVYAINGLILIIGSGLLLLLKRRA